MSCIFTFLNKYLNNQGKAQKTYNKECFLKTAFLNSIRLTLPALGIVYIIFASFVIVTAFALPFYTVGKYVAEQTIKKEKSSRLILEDGSVKDVFYCSVLKCITKEGSNFGIIPLPDQYTIKTEESDSDQNSAFDSK